MKKINWKRIGLALEAFGVSILGCGIADLSRVWLISGMIISGIGRAIVMYIGEEKPQANESKDENNI